VFGASDGVRSIDRIATLTATQPVHIRDNKEGTLGLRVARALEQPDGKENAGATGKYTSSEGKVGDAVWGTRGRWTLLSGTVSAEPVTLAILDHPSNPGYPTHWHARGYGLFAANPLGQKALNDGEVELNLDLARGGSATFRYRVLILNAPADAARVEREWQAFSRETS
jgi:hypothetical protein